MIKHRVTAIILLSFLTKAFLPWNSYAEEIIYDSPEDLQATEPTPIAPPPPPAAEVKPVEPPKPRIEVVAANDAAEVILDPLADAFTHPPEKKTPTEEATLHLAELKQRIDSSNASLDQYFEYAQLATSLGKLKDAAEAYKTMLTINPEIDRVKLEIALVDMQMGKFRESKQYFGEVLAKNPPEEVKANVSKVMEIVDNGLKPDVFSGSVAIGYNLDTNPTSAASSGQTTFIDLSLPLSPGSTASRDGHEYVSASLTHNHKFDIGNAYKLSFETSGSVYKTHQDTETSLDLTMASIKAGPIIEIPDINTRLGLNVSESLLYLDNHKYMKIRSFEQNASYAVMDNLLVNGAYSYEYRNFMNTGLATAYTDRTGNANQQTLGVTYALTPNDLFNSTVTWRYETAANEIYGNTQQSITGSYTRILPWDLTFNASGGYKITTYHEPDPLISAATLRHDRERSATLAMAKKLPYNITATTAYQYKNSESNIQNYKYTDHRYSAGLGWSF